MAKAFRRSIYLYDLEGEPRVMNYAQIGDCLRRDGTKSTFAFLSETHGVSTEKVERGHGHSRQWVVLVTDRNALIAAAKVEGIEVLL